jgi:predicted O-linked N-acetylglucosamine transferase (SPINDLY family)
MTKTLSVPELIRAAETLKQNNQTNAVEALYAVWVTHNNNHPLLYAVLFNYAVILSDGGKLQAARECLEQALKLNPEFLPAHINLGRIYERLGSSALAVVQWSIVLSKLVAVDGAAITYKTTALNQSARALEAVFEDDSAEQLLRQSLELDREQREVVQHLVALRQRQCEWPSVLTLERVDHRTQMRGLSPLSAAALADDPLYHLGLAHHYNQMDVGIPSRMYREWPAVEVREKRLRIGYLSSDLREHAVGFLMTEVFALHERANIEVFSYYCGPETNDSLHEHFKTTSDHFVSITNLSDEAAAQRILEDGIQILVDLNGYTRDARLKLVSMRPAPIIVNWLGFPGTMASPYHHYIIADDAIIPKTHELYYTEKVVRLPCYQPSHRHRKVGKTPMRRELELPEDAFVFCCFNGTHKLTRFTFERWLTILSRVPGSVLWLLSSIESAHERLRTYAEQRGISRERLIFATKLPNPEHLARYPLADLFLDTSPYGAHTTASDALWMGVPVLTFAGRSFASRVCCSLVIAAGTPDMVCDSSEAYVERAAEFGNQRERLKPIRERLVLQRETCTLFDMSTLVRRLEELYAAMWQDFKNGDLPRPNLFSLDVLLELGCQVDQEHIEMLLVSDYYEFYRERLTERHNFRPIARDNRLKLLGFSGNE